MNKKFLAYAATVLSILAFSPVNASVHENVHNTENEIIEEQAINIDELIARVEEKHKIINQKEMTEEFLKFKIAGNTAFEKTQKFFTEIKEKIKMDAISEIELDEEKEYEEITQIMQKTLEKGVVETAREAYIKNNNEYLFTPEVIEELKQNEQYYKEMAEAMLQGPKFYVEWSMNNLTNQDLVLLCDDDKIMNSIIENLLEAEENFNKIV